MSFGKVFLISGRLARLTLVHHMGFEVDVVHLGRLEELRPPISTSGRRPRQKKLERTTSD